MKTLAFLLMLMAFSSLGWGSVSGGPKGPKSWGVAALKEVLAKEDESKFAQLHKMGPRVYPELKRLAFDDEQVLSYRWKAFMAMARIGEREAIPEVKHALESNDWFLRNAALRVLPALDRDLAFEAALGKLDDSALVVRAAAVDTLGHLKRSEAAKKLWEQLYSKENFIKTQSLWIRRHIIEALAEIAPKGAEEKFIKVLGDSDSTLFEPAIMGLEKITGEHIGDPSAPAVYRRHAWEQWFAQRSKK